MNTYFYFDQNTNQQYGPLSIDELRRRGISTQTLVWTNGMSDWIEAGKVPELSNLFYHNSTSYNNAESSYQYQQQANNPYEYNNRSHIEEIRPMPKTWFVESILVTLLCSLVFGIVGIIFSSKVEPLYQSGDYEGSLKASNSAKLWVAIGFFSTIAILLLCFIFYASIMGLIFSTAI